MKIGEIAKRTGFSRDTLRYYEKLGLIQLSKQNRSENNYRIYDDTVLKKLMMIRKMKNSGFTLNEIKLLFRMDELDMIRCSSVEEMVQAKLDKIEQQILALQKKKKRLNTLVEKCQGHCLETINQQD